MTEAQLPTWEDLEREALYDPWLHQMVTRVRLGVLTREQALIVVALAMSKELRKLQDLEVERLRNQPMRFTS